MTLEPRERGFESLPLPRKGVDRPGADTLPHGELDDVVVAALYDGDPIPERRMDRADAAVAKATVAIFGEGLRSLDISDDGVRYLGPRIRCPDDKTLARSLEKGRTVSGLAAAAWSMDGHVPERAVVVEAGLNIGRAVARAVSDRTRTVDAHLINMTNRAIEETFDRESRRNGTMAAPMVWGCAIEEAVLTAPETGLEPELAFCLARGIEASYIVHRLYEKHYPPAVRKLVADIATIRDNVSNWDAPERDMRRRYPNASDEVINAKTNAVKRREEGRVLVDVLAEFAKDLADTRDAIAQRETDEEDAQTVAKATREVQKAAEVPASQEYNRLVISSPTALRQRVRSLLEARYPRVDELVPLYAAMYEQADVNLAIAKAGVSELEKKAIPLIIDYLYAARGAVIRKGWITPAEAVLIDESENMDIPPALYGKVQALKGALTLGSFTHLDLPEYVKDTQGKKKLHASIYDDKVLAALRAACVYGLSKDMAAEGFSEGHTKLRMAIRQHRQNRFRKIADAADLRALPNSVKRALLGTEGVVPGPRKPVD